MAVNQTHVLFNAKVNLGKITAALIWTIAAVNTAETMAVFTAALVNFAR